MNEKVLEEAIEIMNNSHKKTMLLIAKKGIDPLLKKEYTNKLSQYDNVFESLETMKNQLTEARGVESLLSHQIKVIRSIIEYEEEIQKKLMI